MKVMVVKWPSDLVNKKNSVLPVCDKHYHTNNRNVQKWEKIEVVHLCLDRTFEMFMCLFDVLMQ